MAASFATYASQYFAKPSNGAASTSEVSQPMFFSFTTDDGSHHGGHDTDLDDLDDPHLRGSSGMGLSTPIREEEEEESDPYLRLDEDEDAPRAGFQRTRQQQQQKTLLARSPSPAPSDDSQPGWLAHLAGGAVSPKRRRSPSPAPSSESESAPPAELFVASPHGNGKGTSPRTPHSLSLTDALLPRDGRARPLDVFSLPDPRHTSRKRRRYHDATWTAVWLTCVSLCVFFCLLLLVIAKKPTDIPGRRLPYTVYLHTVPLVTILTFLSAGAAYAHIWLLRVFVKPMMVVTSVFIPATLFISAVWAFVGSFMWDGDETPTWGETVGLRLFSLVPLTLSIITARRLLHLPRQIHTTSSTLTLTTHLLMLNPFLLALSPAILLAMLLASLPFVTLIFKLLLIGYANKVGPDTGIVEWHMHAWANWAIVGTFSVWLWSWMVARGVLRMTCASVIGAWYFADPAAPILPPTSTHTIHAAVVRSTGPSLGTIVLAGLILTIVHVLSLVTIALQRLPFYLRRVPWVPLSIPIALYVIPGIGFVVGYLEGVTTALSRYALVYTGLTGDEFWYSAKRARTLVTGVEMEGVEDEVEAVDERNARGVGRNRDQERAQEEQRRRRVRRMTFGSEPPLTLLTVSPLTLTFPFALTTYLFVAHTLGAPHYALGASLLAGGVTALVGLFCVGLVKDTADTLYLCYCIDKDCGEMRREEVFIAFEYDATAGPSGPGRPSRARLGPEPEQIVPLSAQPQGRPPQPGAGRRPPPEVLFDARGGQGAVDEESSDDDEDDRLIAMGVKPSPLATKPKIGPLPMPIRNVPLSPHSYLEDRTPVQRAYPQAPPVKEEEDDMDPFKRSVYDEEPDKDRDLESGTGFRKGAVNIATTPVGRMSFSPPSARSPPGGTIGGVGLGGQHRRIGSGGHGNVGPGGLTRQRDMMSSAEMNMKSQFLMNLRPYDHPAGSSSSTTPALDASELGMAKSMSLSRSHRSEAEEDVDVDDDDDSVLGPGSGFFNQ